MSLKSRRRSDYPFFQSYRTRWNDNDQYGHINNAVYYFLIDSIVNSYLSTHCSHSPLSSPHIGLVVSSHCSYFAPTSFPTTLELGLRVAKIGTSSVTYEVGIFEEAGDSEVCAVGGFVHVFVERESRRPVGVLEEGLRVGLGKLAVGTREEGGEEGGRRGPKL
ncbi:hypothetical protein RUND412_004112 [Rhizina undulata]